MTNTPDPLENPLAERMHRTLKEEFKLERGFRTFEQAQEAVEKTIFIYNHKYPHGSLGYLTRPGRRLIKCTMERSLAKRNGRSTVDERILQKWRKGSHELKEKKEHIPNGAVFPDLMPRAAIRFTNKEGIGAGKNGRQIGNFLINISTLNLNSMKCTKYNYL